MKDKPKLILTSALKTAAERCVWFERPEEAIRTPERLAAHILTYGMHEDTKALVG